MQLQEISEMPPLAIIAFGVSLAIIFFVTRSGFTSGKNTPPATSSSSAQVAAVIVDSSALNRATAALEAHTFEAINMRKSFERSIELLCKTIEIHGREIDEHKTEMIRKRPR